MHREKKPAIRVKLTDVSEELTQKLGRELEGRESEGSRSATGWNDPYRASGVKHGSVN
jgi:hypothetical protein